MSTDLTTQRLVHRFFIDRLHDDATFTKEQVQQLTGWDKSSVDTYWSKQFKGFLDQVSGGYRVRENFRPYISWRKFRTLATQVKVVVTGYDVEQFTAVVCFEFYLPLTHEAALRTSLDSLFYKDVVEPRVRRLGRMRLIAAGFDDIAGENDDAFFARVMKLVDDRFGGYSIYHVSGRFRSTTLSTLDQAVEMQRASGRYLVDETTAVVRFIFPCSSVPEARRVRHLFNELFVTAVTQLISGEDEIWVVESGLENRVHKWKPKE